MTWTGKDQRRDLQDLRKLSRWPLLSYARKEAAPKAPREKSSTRRRIRFPTLAAFTPQRAFEFVVGYLRNRFGPRHSFEVYRRSDPDTGVYELDAEEPEVRIALCGDWGTGTDEAYHVAQRILNCDPHYTIHLGDIYYVGGDNEVNHNLLGENNVDSEYLPCSWPCGSVGSFSLLGNHEALARGGAYFNKVLRALGLTKSVVIRSQVIFAFKTITG